jgi:hypothetical protein
MRNDILMFHSLMRAMPLNHEMSIGEICQAVKRDRGSIVGECEPTVRRALQIDQDVYFEQYAGDLWKRVKDYKPIRLGGI